MRGRVGVEVCSGAVWVRWRALTNIDEELLEEYGLVLSTDTVVTGVGEWQAASKKQQPQAAR